MLRNPVVFFVYFILYYGMKSGKNILFNFLTWLFGWEIGPELFMILILKILKIGYFSRHLYSLLVPANIWEFWTFFNELEFACKFWRKALILW